MDLPESFIFCRSKLGDPIWVIDKYMDIGVGRTVVGELIYQIKYAQNLKKDEELKVVVKHSVLQLTKFPDDVRSLRQIDAVVAVPTSAGKLNPLPRLIASTVRDALDISDWSDKLTRIGDDGPAKTGNSVTPSMFRVETSMTDRRVLVVDDVYRTGSTIGAMSTCLRSAGVRSIVGLCLAKADQGMK